MQQTAERQKSPYYDVCPKPLQNKSTAIKDMKPAVVFLLWLRKYLLYETKNEKPIRDVGSLTDIKQTTVQVWSVLNHSTTKTETEEGCKAFWVMSAV